MLTRSVNFNSAGPLPVSVDDGGISGYINKVKAIPRLSEEEERALAVRLSEERDLQAAEKLVKSNLYLVVAAAFEYRGYGLPMADIISEGNVGLMRAVKKYDPNKGFRLSTYALWWIRATMNEFVLASWSLVKIGTQAAERKLFFGLRKLKARLGIYHEGSLSGDEVKRVASEMKLAESEVAEMDGRLVRDASLNGLAAGDDGGEERIEKLASPMPTSEELVADAEEGYAKRRMLMDALGGLSPRERTVIERRRLLEAPATLEELSVLLGVSKERVRQIENRAMEKLSSDLLKRKGEYMGEE
ncbi:MAG: RNA polymerase factor sigma-32 [Rickettsiales bacterium]|nr:RNA polymerase factor sigma-32 [Rickettsiales bacterium]